MKTKIKEYRAKYNVTQADLAKKVGVRRETISFLEKGQYNPSLKLAVRIAQQFQVSVEDVFIFEESDWE
ncbi:helix-turn-helix transcriptional regulator [Bacillus sp. 165]|uniref:helix-turn-helix transcriptional regulator n=1 Tax=Bacillus sp. 165 TaxID=1529117 RepID=UPI001ADA0F81|nr:helix-turn-helix transcriptional regulator [Bacillus sp. 165]MBO9129526.1 helix-turn-helix transcriptional regulator [Bacillus sp. 165]